MKKYLIAYSLLVGLCTNAQVVADPVHQFLRAGDNIFEVYYGGPNFFKNPLTANLDGGKIVSRSGIGHTGFRFENFLNTHFSIGVETAFVQGEYDVRNTVTTYDPITYVQAVRRPCASSTCVPGMACIPDSVAGCGGPSCCTEFCGLFDTAGNAQCIGKAERQECLGAFDPAMKPAYFEHIGICWLP